MSNHRIDRMNEEIRRELAEIIRELKDPRLSTMTSVTTVTVTKDLHFCKVFVSIMGDDEQKKNTLVALKAAAGFIRKEIGHRVNLRNTPEFHFELDDSIAYGAHINELIEQMNKGDS